MNGIRSQPEAMFRQRLNENNSFQYTPRSSQHNLEKVEKPFISEWKLAIIGLVLSIIVIIAKISHANYEFLKSLLIEPKLISYEEITEDGQIMLKYAWKSVVKFSNIWLPAVCGILTTYFTWMMVYLDSHVPGVQPPSPFSPTKYKTTSGHSFHLNYIFAVVVGLAVALYMYWRQISIQY